MDCIKAQSVISEALDRSPVDAAALEAAKAHCRECDQCGAYVRALDAVRRAPLPEMPADLVTRIMTEIRTEAEAAKLSTEAAASDTPAESESAEHDDAALRTLLEPASPDDASPVGTADEPTGHEPPPAVLETARRLSLGRSPRDRRTLIAWGSAAAALLILVGVGGALGIMRLVNGPPQAALLEVAPTAAPGDAGAAKSADSVVGEVGESARSTAPLRSGAAVAAPSLYIVVSSQAYMHTGAASGVEKSELASIGQARMSFESSSQPAALRTVFKGSDPGVIYAENDAGELQRFIEIVRSYKGKVYRLQSADVTEYGGWPTIPSGVPRPVPENAADGAPVFTLDGKDDFGASVYHRVGADARIGIAIPPNTASSDPAAGNPNWTWWTPQTSE